MPPPLPLVADVPASTPGHKKAFGNSAGRTGGLGITASCRTRARNRARLRGPRRAHRRHDLATLCRDPWHARRLSRARSGLAADAATRMASPMKTATRRSLRRVRRVNDLAAVGPSCSGARNGSHLRDRGLALSRRDRGTLRCDTRYTHRLPGHGRGVVAFPFTGGRQR